MAPRRMVKGTRRGVKACVCFRCRRYPLGRLSSGDTPLCDPFILLCTGNDVGITTSHDRVAEVALFLLFTLSCRRGEPPLEADQRAPHKRARPVLPAVTQARSKQQTRHFAQDPVPTFQLEYATPGERRTSGWKRMPRSTSVEGDRR